MEVIKIKGGHRFRIKNGPENKIVKLNKINCVALSLIGFKNLKPKIIVKEGEKILLGQDLFFDKKNKQIRFTSPGGGIVSKINYGYRRTLKSIVIKLSKKENTRNFGAISKKSINSLSFKDVSRKLLKAGLWQLFNVFPGDDYAPADGVLNSHGEQIGNKIDSIYISTFNTEPHSVNAELVLNSQNKNFIAGLKVLCRLSKKIFLFSRDSDILPKEILNIKNINYKIIENKYPAEKLGTQVFYTNRLEKNKISIGADLELVINIGYLFSNGILRSERIFSVSGNGVKKRHHVLGRIGMMVKDLCTVENVENRFVAGGILSGKKIKNNDFLGLMHSSLNVLKEDRYRIPFAFLRFGFNKLTLSKTWFGGFNKKVDRNLSTSNNGEERACIQCGYCLDICPVDLMPNLIMKASLNCDIEKMESCSIHDCVDCGLCTFVCPSKIELSKNIKDGKNIISKEG